jgi:hypothetical protein
MFSVLVTVPLFLDVDNLKGNFEIIQTSLLMVLLREAPHLTGWHHLRIRFLSRKPSGG